MYTILYHFVSILQFGPIKYVVERVDYVCNSLHCDGTAEKRALMPFPAVERVIFLKGKIPHEYLSLSHDKILVIMKETTIPPNENWGGQVSILPATEEVSGYYLIFGDIKVCGHGPYRHVSACDSNFVYPRDAIWYIERVVDGYQIHRGQMCITKLMDEISYSMQEHFGVQLRTCQKNNPDQVFKFDHVDNLYS